MDTGAITPGRGYRHSAVGCNGGVAGRIDFNACLKAGAECKLQCLMHTAPQ